MIKKPTRWQLIQKVKVTLTMLTSMIFRVIICTSKHTCIVIHAYQILYTCANCLLINNYLSAAIRHHVYSWIPFSPSPTPWTLRVLRAGSKDQAKTMYMYQQLLTHELLLIYITYIHLYVLCIRTTRFVYFAGGKKLSACTKYK